MKTNFIRNHLLREIFKRSLEVKTRLQVPEDSFIYFDELISTYKINRFGRGNFYPSEKVVPINWKLIDAKILLEAFDKIRENKIFVIKNADGNPYRARLK